MKLLVLIPILLLTGCASMGANVVGAKARSFDGTEIVYDARGHGEPALVFIHGWCCNRGQWDAQMDAFEDDHRVVAIDLAGHGESGRTRAKWTVTDYPHDVEAVVEAEGLDRVILVGHSMGGPVGLMAAALMPDRVIGVIGVETLQDASIEFNAEAMAPLLKRIADDFPAFVERFMQRNGAANPDATPALVDRLKRDALANDPEMAVALTRTHLDLSAAELLQACPVPVRCINAAGGAFPTNIEVNRQYCDFDASEIENVGHWPMLEKTQEFNRLLREQIAALAVTR